MASKRERALWGAALRGGKQLPKSKSGLAMPGLRVPFSGRILGIDPSLRGTGIAVVTFTNGHGTLEISQTLRFPAKISMIDCLGKLALRVGELAQEFPITAVAIEETIYVQNYRTAQILGAARGAIIGSLAAMNLPVSEYPPLRVKQAVSGFGRASKEQVAGQVKALLRLPESLPFDESDAAAVAICHALTSH